MANVPWCCFECCYLLLMSPPAQSPALAPPRPPAAVGGGARQWHPQLLLLREQQRGVWQWWNFLGRFPTPPGTLWNIPRSPRTLRRTTAPLDNVPKYFVTSTHSRITLQVMIVRRWTLFQIFLFAALLFHRCSSLRRFWKFLYWCQYVLILNVCLQKCSCSLWHSLYGKR